MLHRGMAKGTDAARAERAADFRTSRLFMADLL